jgi:tetratricopeptide (TPR) repeat protein
MRQLVIAVSMIVGAGGAPPASADEPKPLARQHVERATALHKDGQFAEALAELQTAYALDPQPQLLFAMGQLHVRLGQCTQAITFYERFLASRPARGPAGIATEAIAACKTEPPPADPPARPASVADQLPAPAIDVTLPPAPLAPPVTTVAPPRERAWYTDYVADALVVGGIASGVAALVTYRGALADRDRAETATSYEAYVERIDRAHTQRTYAVVLGAAGVALATAGGLHYVLSDRGRTDHGVQIAPGRGGGVVSWSTRF